MKPKLHAFNGETGAGKTTHSRKLARDLNAFRLSHDELLTHLFDAATLQADHARCCERANQLAWKLIGDISALGVDIVIEGWGSRKLRDQVRTRARALDLEVSFYDVRCPPEERLRRIHRRNQNPTADAPFISDAAFHRMEALDEAFEADETFTVIDNAAPDPACSPSG